MIIKKCTVCNVEKIATTENYHKQKNGKYGLNSKCRSCISIEQKQYRSKPESKERHRLYNAEWRLKNPEKSKEINRKCRVKNSEKYNELAKIKLKTDINYQQRRKLEAIKYKNRRKEINALPENMEKSRLRSRKRREILEVRKKEYQRYKVYRDANKDRLNEYDRNKRKELCASYVACSIRVSVNSVPTEIIETQRLIMSLKRELKLNNIKIK